MTTPIENAGRRVRRRAPLLCAIAATVSCAPDASHETGRADSPEALATAVSDDFDTSRLATEEASAFTFPSPKSNREGRGAVFGRVGGPGAVPPANISVIATSPGTGRTWTATVDIDGNYRIEDIALGTTVVVIASVPRTAATTARVGSVTPDRPNARIDLTIPVDPINHGFVNPDFSDGLNGWQTTGSVRVVPRGKYFDLPDDE